MEPMSIANTPYAPELGLGRHGGARRGMPFRQDALRWLVMVGEESPARLGRRRKCRLAGSLRRREVNGRGRLRPIVLPRVFPRRGAHLAGDTASITSARVRNLDSACL